MSKGIYIQLLSRCEHIQHRKPHLISESSFLSLRNYADNIIHYCFHKFKSGDVSDAKIALKKLRKLIPSTGQLYFATNFCTSLGFLRNKEYEEVILSLSRSISTSGYSIIGLCDALIVLSEAYAAMSRFEESLHSARLAVDVAHDRLEKARNVSTTVNKL